MGDDGVAGMVVARDSLGIVRHGRMLQVVDELLFALQLDEEVGPVVVRRKHLASVTDQQASAVGQFALHRQNVGGDFDRRLVAQVMASTKRLVRLAAVVPPQRHRVVLDLAGVVEEMRMLEGNVCGPLGKGKADLRADRIGFLVHGPEGRRLDLCRVIEIERAKRHVDGVAGHVAQRAGTEILPATPVERLVDALLILRLARTLERPHGSRTNPDVPIQGRGNRVFSHRTLHALRPHRAVRPHMNLVHLADEAVLDRLHGATQAVRGAALVAHLRDELSVMGHVP